MRLKIKKPSFQLLSYLFLLLILAGGLSFFYLLIGFPDKQFFVIAATAFFYFCWGVVFHLLEGDLHPKVVIEYLLTSILAIILLRGLLYR